MSRVAILGTWDALLNKINQVFSLHGAEILSAAFIGLSFFQSTANL